MFVNLAMSNDMETQTQRKEKSDTGIFIPSIASSLPDWMRQPRNIGAYAFTNLSKPLTYIQTHEPSILVFITDMNASKNINSYTYIMYL